MCISAELNTSQEPSLRRWFSSIIYIAGGLLSWPRSAWFYNLSRSVIISDGVLHISNSQKRQPQTCTLSGKKRTPKPQGSLQAGELASSSDYLIEGRGHRLTNEKCVGYSCTRQEGGTPTPGRSPGRGILLHQAGGRDSHTR